MEIKTLKEKVASTIYPNGKGAINAADHQTLLLDVVDSIDESNQFAAEGIRGLASYTSKDLKLNEVLANSGASYPASTIVASDYLPIPSDAVWLQYNLAANNVYLCLYDASKVFIAFIKVTDNSKLVKGEINLSQYDASYFRFNCKIDFLDKCYVTFSDMAKMENLSAVSKSFQEDLYAGYYDKTNLVYQQALDQNGNSVSASTIKASDYLPIPSDVARLQYNLAANDVCLCLYDASKTFIAFIKVTDNSKLVKGEINLSQYGASYFRFNCKIDFMDDCYVKLLKGNSGGGSNGSGEALNAIDFGAKGNGIADDTQALEALFEAAYEQKKPIYIPQGTYMIRRSLPIRSNLHIYGEGKNSVIKKMPAAWSKVTQDITEGDTIIYVESVNDFVVGSQIFITNNTDKTNVAARHCSIGIIEEINSSNNSIKFRSSYEGIKSGAIKSQSKGCYISSSCAVLRSWSMFAAATNVRIHDITLDGNRQDGEPMEWFNAPIHFDPDDRSTLYGIEYKYASYDHIIRDCYCVNSSFDGISDQGSANCTIENVTISNSAMHGVHFGTSFTNGKVYNCNISGNGERGAAIFFCAGVKNIVASGNMISNYYRGTSDEEYGSEGTDAIIIGNIFENISDVAFNFPMASEARIGGRHLFANNLLRNIGSLFKGDHLKNVSINHNIIQGANENKIFIAITESDNVSIVGNILDAQMSQPIDLTGTNKVVNVDNTWNL